MRKEKKKLLYIPHETVLDILLKLPVKSLLQFKAVCKPWGSLISDPQFVKAHLNLANEGNNVKVANLICSREEPRPSVSLTSADCEGLDCKVAKLDYRFKKPLDDAEILGSCNGLLLISVGFDTYLWNPSTGEYKKIPTAPSHSSKCRFYISGLGYDSSDDEYKAVIATHIVTSRGSPPDGYIYINIHKFLFTSKTGSWALIEDYDFPYNISSNGQGATVSGAPHWVARRDNEDYYSENRVIIYFDLAEEKFKEMPQPDSLGRNSKFDVAVLGGCICIVHNHAGSHVEVWAMKEYGVKESWTNLFVIQHSVEYLMPLVFTKNGEVLMEIKREKLVTYCLRRVREEYILSSRNRFGFKVATYVESLVSPNGAIGTNQAHGERERG